MQPTSRDLHVDQYLTGVSVGYRNLGYIADQIFPILPVPNQSGLIPAYDQSHWFRDEARLRAPGTKSEGSGWTVTQSNFYCDRYSFRKEIDDEVRDNADSQWNLDRDAVEFVTDKLQMRRERAFAAKFFTTGVWNTDAVAGVGFTAWSDYAGSTPLVNVDDYRDGVEALIGREPNTLVISKAVWLKLKWHPDLIDVIKYTQRGVVTEDLVKSLFGIDRLLIGRALVTTDPEGTAESAVTYSRIWGKNALLTYVPDRPSLMNPAAGYTFVWQRVPSAIQYMKRMRDEEREVDIIEGNSYFDQRLVGARSGVFLSNVVA